MRFIDTHTHYCDEAFVSDADQAICKAVNAGVCKMIHPDVDSKERDLMFAMVGRHKSVMHAMLGLYPGSVDKCWREEMDIMMKYLDREIVAIGEVGLDYHYGAEFAEEQKEVLRIQLELASRMNLPVNIHLREAIEDFINIMKDCRHLGLRGNLHAYSGSFETFERMQKYGDWSIGVGGVVTFKKAGLAEVVRRVPLDRIVLETDSPYLTPVPYRGSRNESAYIPIIAAKIAELKETSIEEVAEITTRNAELLFGI